jgi:hypothetical protein
MLLVVALASACVSAHGERPNDITADASETTRADATAPDAARPAVHDADADGSQQPLVDGGTHAAEPMTFTLENAGAQPLVIGSSCGGSWLRIKRAGRAVEIDRSCRCSCREMESSQGCLSCPAVCTSTEKQLAPGGSERVEWDGIQLDDANGKGCYVEGAFAIGTELVAEACWNVDAQTGSGTCMSQTFAYGVDRDVVLRAKPVASAPSAVALKLENRTGATIEVRERCGGLWSWFDIKAPGVVTSTAAFCPCRCDERYGNLGCATCGGCADDVVHSVAPGASLGATWDGTLVYSYPSGCAQRWAVPIGSPLTIDFCWRVAGADAGTEKCTHHTIVHGVATVTLLAQ